jgi:hypothetical protein
MHNNQSHLVRKPETKSKENLVTTTPFLYLSELNNGPRASASEPFFIWQLLQSMEFDAKMHLSWSGKKIVQLPY